MPTLAQVERWLQNPLVVRGMSLVIAVGTGTVLGLAAWLDPSPEGHGTHLQLGLGTCSFLQATDIPCPMCGATTTFALMAHFRWFEAVLTQPFAVLLFVLTLTGFVVASIEAVQPKGRWGRLLRPLEPYEGWLAIAFLGCMGLGWAYKAVVMGAISL